MTREESWQAEGMSIALLQRTTSLGYTVGVHRMGPSLHGTSGAYVEMHAIDERTEPVGQYMARVGVAEGGNTDYRCACLLAEAVGISLKVKEVTLRMTASTPACPAFFIPSRLGMGAMEQQQMPKGLLPAPTRKKVNVTVRRRPKSAKA